MKKPYLVIFFGIALMSCLGISVFGKTNSESNNAKLPVSNIHASYAIDVYDIDTVIGFSDYVFVAEVDSLLKTEYNGSLPYSVYSVKVLENLKGKLITDKDVVLRKVGGSSADGKTIFVYDDDILPEVGGRYIFVASGQPDGSLIVSGVNSTFSLDDVEIDTDYKQASKIYKEINDGVENQIGFARERFKAKYDQN